MKKVVLLCAAGMSTSLLVERIKTEAKNDNYEIDIEALPISQYMKVASVADIILLGPQIRFELAKVKAAANCPVEAIDMSAYGMMDGKKVLQQIKQTLGD